MKTFSTLLLFLLVAFSSATAEPLLNVSDNANYKWKSQDNNAIIAVNKIYEDGSKGVIMFVVSFDIKTNCSPDFGFSMLQGNGYEKLIKTDLVKKGDFKIFVDEKIAFDDDLFFNRYSNGIEWSWVFTDKIFNKIVSGKKISFVLDEIGTIILPTTNSKQSIENAAKFCTDYTNKIKK